MKVELTCWEDWGDPHDVGYNACGRRQLGEVILSVSKLDEIPNELKRAGFEFTGYKIKRCILDAPVPVVEISVNGGVAEVVSLPPGVKVIIHDYDNEKNTPEGIIYRPASYYKHPV